MSRTPFLILVSIFLVTSLLVTATSVLIKQIKDNRLPSSGQDLSQIFKDKNTYRLKEGTQLTVDELRVGLGSISEHQKEPTAALALFVRDSQQLNKVVDLKIGDKITIGKQRIEVLGITSSEVFLRITQLSGI